MERIQGGHGKVPCSGDRHRQRTLEASWRTLTPRACSLVAPQLCLGIQAACSASLVIQGACSASQGQGTGWVGRAGFARTLLLEGYWEVGARVSFCPGLSGA